MVAITHTLFAKNDTDDDLLASSLVAFGGVVVAMTTSVLVLKRRRRKVMDESPSSEKTLATLPTPPNSHWLLGDWECFRQFFHKANPYAVLEHANQYGQVGMRIGPTRPSVVVSHIEDASKVLTSEYIRIPPEHVRKHASMCIGPKNIGNLRGREWRMHRSAIYRSMTPNSLKRCRSDMVSVAQHMVSSLSNKLAEGDTNPTAAATASPPSMTMDMEPLMKMITIDIFAKTTLSVDLKCCQTLKSSPIAVAFDFLMDEIGRRVDNPLNPFDYFYNAPTAMNRRHARERTLLRSFLGNLLEQRRGDISSEHTKKKNSKTNDLLDHLIEAHEHECATAGTAELVSNQTLNDTLVALMFAGYDTTSVTLTYALYCISQNETVERRCLEEIRRSLAKRRQGKAEAEDSDAWKHLDPEEDLVYCRAVLMETLRLHPPGGVTTRLLQKPVQLQGGLTVPQNTRVFIPIAAIQRMERHYGENASQFCPERWLGDGASRAYYDDNKKENVVPPLNPKTAFLAFSAGGRSCPGQKFAMQEASLVLAVLLHHFSFRALPEYKLETIRKGIVYHPKDGIPMMIQARGTTSLASP